VDTIISEAVEFDAVASEAYEAVGGLPAVDDAPTVTPHAQASDDQADAQAAFDADAAAAQAAADAAALAASSPASDAFAGSANPADEFPAAPGVGGEFSAGDSGSEFPAAPDPSVFPDSLPDSEPAVDAVASDDAMVDQGGDN